MNKTLLSVTLLKDCCVSSLKQVGHRCVWLLATADELQIGTVNSASTFYLFLESIQKNLPELCECRPGCKETSYTSKASLSVIHEDKIPALIAKYIGQNSTSLYEDHNYVR